MFVTTAQSDSEPVVTHWHAKILGMFCILVWVTTDSEWFVANIWSNIVVIDGIIYQLLAL